MGRQWIIGLLVSLVRMLLQLFAQPTHSFLICMLGKEHQSGIVHIIRNLKMLEAMHEFAIREMPTRARLPKIEGIQPILVFEQAIGGERIGIYLTCQFYFGNTHQRLNALKNVNYGSGEEKVIVLAAVRQIRVISL